MKMKIEELVRKLREHAEIHAEEHRRYGDKIQIDWADELLEAADLISKMGGGDVQNQD